MTRRAIPRAVKAEAAVQQHGLCACGLVLLGTAELDHIVPLALGGTNEADNLLWRHKSCHLEKTRADVKAIRKADRIARKLAGTQKRRGSKLQSRGFDKRLRKRMDGTVEVRG